MADWFSMGGYGFYVWSAYGVSFFVLSTLVFFQLKRLGQVKNSNGEDNNPESQDINDAQNNLE